MSELACPVCRTPMASLALAGFSASGCARCGGLWLDNAASRMLADGSVPREARGPLRSWKRSASSDGSYRATASASAARACPACNAPLAAVREPSSGVGLDVCGPHGTWFDEDELDAVLQWAEVRKVEIDEEGAQLRQDIADDRFEKSILATALGKWRRLWTGR